MSMGSRFRAAPYCYKELFGVADDIVCGNDLFGDGVYESGVVRACEADIIVGPALHHAIVVCVFPENGATFTELRGDENVVFFLTEFEETGSVLMADGNGYFLAEFQCGCARAVAVGEDMEVGDGERINEGEHLGEFLLGFTIETGHDVGCDAGVGHHLCDAFQFSAVKGCVVAAVHKAQHMVGTRL